ncbi:MAG: OmpA family protein, partial [Bacteroidota bacterium]
VDIQIGELKETVKVEGDGYFSIQLNENKNYSFLGSSPGYLTNQAYFSTFGVGKDPNNPVQRFEVEIVLDKIYSNQEITLENIYYDFDRWEIRSDAEPTLNKLAENLKLNPEIRIQIGSHTDCRGNDRYNEDLSQKRAESAVDFLISKGIEPDRLTAKGYGEDSPSVDCICTRCSENEHQKNRRTTFAIIEY